MIRSLFTVDFGKQILKSAISLTAAQYTAKGIQAVVDYTASKITGQTTPRRPRSDDRDVIDAEPSFE